MQGKGVEKEIPREGYLIGRYKKDDTYGAFKERYLWFYLTHERNKKEEQANYLLAILTAQLEVLYHVHFGQIRIFAFSI